MRIMTSALMRAQASCKRKHTLVMVDYILVPPCIRRLRLQFKMVAKTVFETIFRNFRCSLSNFLCHKQTDTGIYNLCDFDAMSKYLFVAVTQQAFN